MREELPISRRPRRMPLCQGRPVVGSAVIVAIPEGTARSRVLSPAALPPHVRSRFLTVISHVKTTGNSGSGIFDAEKKCLLGIMSCKGSRRTSPSGESSMDIAKYFVPAWDHPGVYSTGIPILGFDACKLAFAEEPAQKVYIGLLQAFFNGVDAFQPKADSRVTSRSFRGVPSGFEVS